ncbi:hypothetical protein GCM10007981_16930 [Thermocladium modestius]|uniref:Uncharacterized protein n=1 Tax=Thermocladium modestius TaxID=62609 RepID=A0A830H0E7_9CREN|nr:hypothetical protein [Thermocladium modestius]GGP22125.1 hypothetical protein GCM10007981_16930 [Thermocladium modestius]
MMINNRRGISESISVVIIMAVVLALIGVMLYVATYYFSNSASSSGISLAESFLINVADDMDTIAFHTGIDRVYYIPSTPYGVMNWLPNYCVYNLSGLVFKDGAVIYGTPPNYYSMPSGFVQVLRGDGEPVSTSPSSVMFQVIQYGEDTLGGETYGTYLALYPRPIIIGNNTNYVYIYMASSMGGGSGRTIMSINVTDTSVVLLGKGSYPLKATCGSETAEYKVTSFGSLYVVYSNYTVTMR